MAANVNVARAWEYPTSVPDGFVGSGIEKDPYQIRNAQDLANLSWLMNNDHTEYWRKYWILTNDIVLNENVYTEGGAPSKTAKQWVPIGKYVAAISRVSFRGWFDGRGHTIRGVYIDDSEGKEKYLGLFGYVSYTSSIENLNVADSYIRGGCGSWCARQKSWWPVLSICCP